MESEKIKVFLSELKAHPRAAELLNGRETPNTPEEAAEFYAGIAKELGYDLTAEELAAYIGEQNAAHRERTDGNAEEVSRLDDSELAAVAGGKDHPDCKDTYKDAENCWFKDACDIVMLHYPDYRCLRNDTDPQETCPSNSFNCFYEQL